MRCLSRCQSRCVLNKIIVIELVGLELLIYNAKKSFL
jgi:hypothetical protein